MNGKLINVSINGQKIECHPDSSFELEYIPAPIGEISVQECNETKDWKIGDEFGDITFNGQFFSKGIVTRNEDGKFYIDVFL